MDRILRIEEAADFISKKMEELDLEENDILDKYKFEFSDSIHLNFYLNLDSLTFYIESQTVKIKINLSLKLIVKSTENDLTRFFNMWFVKKIKEIYRILNAFMKFTSKLTKDKKSFLFKNTEAFGDNDEMESFNTFKTGHHTNMMVCPVIGISAEEIIEEKSCYFRPNDWRFCKEIVFENSDLVIPNPNSETVDWIKHAIEETNLKIDFKILPSGQLILTCIIRK